MTNAINEASITDIVGEIYRAAFEPDAWGTILSDLEVVFRSNSSMLQNVDVDGPGIPLGRLSGMDPAVMAKWADSRDHVDVWYQALKKCRAENAYVGEHLVTTKELLKTAFYSDMLRPHDVKYKLGGSTYESQSRKWVLAVYRGDRQGTYSKEEIDAFRLLTPHFVKVLALSQQHAMLATENLMLAEALNRSPFAIFIHDAFGRVTRLNASAEKTVHETDGVTILNNRMKLWDRAANKTLAKQVGAATDFSVVNGLTEGSFFGANRPSGKKPFQLCVCPNLIESKFCLSSLVGGCVTVLRDPAAQPLPSPNALVAHYGLTNAEAKLCLRIFEYTSLTAAAKASHISVNTAKSQLKAAFRKIDVGSQAELLRELAGFIVAD